MKKFKRILAAIGAALLAGLYLITLILACTGSEETTGLLMASVACTIIIPCLIYSFTLIARILDNRAGHTEEASGHHKERKSTEK